MMIDSLGRPVQYSSGFIGGPTPLPTGKPKTKYILLICYNTTQERMRVREFISYMGRILMVILLELVLDMASSSPADVTSRVVAHEVVDGSR